MFSQLRLVAPVLLLTGASNALADEFPETVAANFKMFHCIDEPEPFPFILTISREGSLQKLLPNGEEVTQADGVLSFRAFGGVFSLVEDSLVENKFSFAGDGKISVGTCFNISYEVGNAISAVAETNPDAFKAYLKDLILVDEAAKATTEAEILAARDALWSETARAETAEKQLSANAEETKLLRKRAEEAEKELKASAEETKLLRKLAEEAEKELKARAEETKTLKAAMADAVVNPNACGVESVKVLQKLTRDLASQRRENDKLKLTICKLNPKATFSICKE